MRNEDANPEEDIVDEVIRQEFVAARNEVKEVCQQEAALRDEIAERAKSHVENLELAAQVVQKHQESEHQRHLNTLEVLKQKLDACVASGDNEGALALIAELSKLEFGG